MARFRFKLQKVLDARNAVEKERKKDLMVARHQLAALNQEYQRINDEISEHRDLFSEQRDQEENANTWAVRQSYLEMLDSLQKAVTTRIDVQKEHIEEKRLKLMEASRERKAMEILRDKHHEEFVMNEDRKEQLFINEIAQYQSMKRNQNAE